MPPAVAPPSARSPQTQAQAQVHLTLELERDSGSALLRVISTLHRRRCRVLHASFRPATSGRDELDLVVHAPAAYAARVEHWLRSLIDVRSAETRPTSAI